MHSLGQNLKTKPFCEKKSECVLKTCVKPICTIIFIFEAKIHISGQEWFSLKSRMS